MNNVIFKSYDKHPNNPITGMIYYNHIYNVMFVYNGNDWVGISEDYKNQILKSKLNILIEEL